LVVVVVLLLLLLLLLLLTRARCRFVPFAHPKLGFKKR
jgi:hypothetical protein